ncbi:MAG: hypothetical protein C0596_03755 [Marinilabiliales bacterium]|nr:MAG: hypothetical protein C0596_03755 [Marinilabiliales bacterium]
MEKLLGFFTSKPVSIVENDNFFKKAFKFIFVFAAAVIAIYGIYNIISVAIDYFDFVFDLDAFPIIRHLLLFLLCLIIVAITYLFVIGALYHRSKLILNDPNNIVDIMPCVFKTFGVIGAIVPISIGLMGFLAALLAADPFIPMDGLIGVISRISIVDLPTAIFGYGVDSFKEYIDQLFNFGLVVLIVSVFVAFVNLVGMYLI